MRSRTPSRKTSTSHDLPDVLQFMRLLWALVHQLQKRSKRMSSELGVTGPQRLVLRVAGLFPGGSAGALAEVLHVHPSTLTGVLQRLVEQGLLKRSADEGDRRRAVLVLTKRGAEINSTTTGTVESSIAQALKRVGRRDAAATERVLALLVEALEQTGPRRQGRRGRL
jgi:MarR family transcriptional regulator, organic hydroperoxide resistance regulator